MNLDESRNCCNWTHVRARAAGARAHAGCVPGVCRAGRGGAALRPAAILGRGEYWRLVTAHFYHYDLTHLAWNLAGLALVAWLFAREYDLRGWMAILVASTVAVDSGSSYSSRNSSGTSDFQVCCMA